MGASASSQVDITDSRANTPTHSVRAGIHEKAPAVANAVRTGTRWDGFTRITNQSLYAVATASWGPGTRKTRRETLQKGDASPDELFPGRYQDTYSTDHRWPYTTKGRRTAQHGANATYYRGGAHTLADLPWTPSGT